MTLTAPTVDTRVRIPDEVIQELISRIAVRFRPQRIILFGSYAQGKPQPESDVDLLVVMDSDLRETEQALKIRQHINPLFGVDFLVISPSRLEERLQMGDWFLREVIETGRVVYESPNARMD